LSLTIAALIVFFAHVLLWLRLPARASDSGTADVELELEAQAS
jgi:hypothetical protein